MITRRLDEANLKCKRVRIGSYKTCLQRPRRISAERGGSPHLSAATVLASDDEHMWMYGDGFGRSWVPPMTGLV